MEKIKIGVVPAAGKGSRIADLPLTKILPKPMLPVLNKPILEYIVNEMKDLGIETIYMIVGHKKEVIQKYFEDGKDFGVNIKYIEQKSPKGIAHAISLTKGLINKPFMVILGDDFTIVESLQNILDTFWMKNAIAVTSVVIEKNITILKQTNCVFLDKDNKVQKIIEKPSTPNSNIRGCGIYVFDPVVYNYIEKTPISKIRNEREITDTLGLMAKEGKVYGVYINGINININSLPNLFWATMIVLKNQNRA